MSSKVIRTSPSSSGEKTRSVQKPSYVIVDDQGNPLHVETVKIGGMSYDILTLPGPRFQRPATDEKAEK